MPATIDPDNHKFSYVNGTNAASRLAGMSEGGPAWIHSDHWLAKVGRDWLPAAVGGKIAMTSHKIEWLFLEGFILNNPVMALGQGWFLGLPLLSQFMAELCWVNIPQDALGEKETRELTTTWAKEKLTTALRTVTPVDLVQDPITSADWHAAATNKQVAGPTGAEGPNQDLSKMRHFRMLFAGGYNLTDQASARFTGLVDLGELAIGKDMTGKPPASICAHALTWHRQICPLQEYDEYVSWDDAESEIAALSLGSATAQLDIFKHRYVRSWRTVYAHISKAFPSAVSGEEAYHLAETMAAKFKLSTPLSRASAAALELLLGRILPALDTDSLKLKSNSDRLAAFSQGDIATARRQKEQAPSVVPWLPVETTAIECSRTRATFDCSQQWKLWPSQATTSLLLTRR